MPDTIKLGLLGNNIGRSRAKDLHELLGKIYGLSLTYRPMDLRDRSEPVSIQSELERCRREGYRGVNITHPFKRDAFPVVTPVQTFPTGLTSVNTVLFNDRKLAADNTDYSGFNKAFSKKFGPRFQPGKVLMLGAGGVGVAIGYALQSLGAEELVIFDTNRKLAAEMVKQMGYCTMTVRLAEDDLRAEMVHAKGLINATPVGMFQYPGCAFPMNGFNAQEWAFDAVYTPENTDFLKSCRNWGIETLSGFKLFLFQGLDAFKLFTGITPDADEVESIFLNRFPIE